MSSPLLVLGKELIGIANGPPPWLEVVLVFRTVIFGVVHVLPLGPGGRGTSGGRVIR